MQLDGFAPAGSALEDLERAWRTSDALFELQDGAWLARPIPLRHPFLFYLGHLPAFAWNQLGRGVLELAPIDREYEDLFERGIDPEDEAAAEASARDRWPDVGAVRAYRDRVRAEIRRVYAEVEACESDLLCRGERIVHLVLEHELMHHETLLYMLHELGHERKRRPAGLPRPTPARTLPRTTEIPIPGGRVTLGADFDELSFGWDNEFPRCESRVEDFRIDRYPVAVGEYLRFVEEGGYEDMSSWSEEGRAWLREARPDHPRGWLRRDGAWTYRTFFEDVPLREVLGWPVLVTQVEADAYARWRGARLPTEAELYRAAHGTPEGVELAFPWGDDDPRPEHGNFGLQRLDPLPIGDSPAGASAFGVEELVGNGWEWSSSRFEPLPGFEPWISTYPGYSTDFFGGSHNVVFGGAWATHPRLLRRSFRNWYQRRYPYAAATFRCARD